MGDWESIFKDQGRFFEEPHADMRKMAKMFRRARVKQVLDLGCGSGRHTVFLAKEGFDVYATDISLSGLKLTREWLRGTGLKGRVRRMDCYERFPFRDGFFDAIVSVQVIHHNTIAKIRSCIAEIERVLKRGGFVFITVPKTKRNRYRSKVRMIADRTFVPLDGHETGVPHYLYNRKLLRRDFRNFDILDLHVDGQKHYCILARKRR